MTHIDLDEAQKQKVGCWVEEGKSLSDIRQLLKDEPEAIEKDEAPAEAQATQEDAEAELLGEVSVNVDAVVRPGAVVSGDVTFSDISVKGATWQLD